MLLESMAGKSACFHGVTHDATPFEFGEDDSAVDYFGEQLRKAGYNYYGTERMYSGITGEEFEVGPVLFGVRRASSVETGPLWHTSTHTRLPWPLCVRAPDGYLHRKHLLPAPPSYGL